MNLPLAFLPEVADALAEGRPVVALESTIITHGMPVAARTSKPRLRSNCRSSRLGGSSGHHRGDGGADSYRAELWTDLGAAGRADKTCRQAVAR